ncbi:MAG: hypothetical protein JW900_12875 [Anaerolineae bacterium]|nr:hypothetical protein [Anaerolineae bacterium]
MKEQKSIVELVDELPKKSITTYVLNALDFVVPGEWENVTGFEAILKSVMRDTDPVRLNRVKQRAIALYEDPASGYRKAIWVYKAVDAADVGLAATALADKVGQKVQFLSFLDRLTPKADITQTVDLAVKVGAEIVAFTLANGLPKDDIQGFADNLAHYAGASKMRMAALVCLDGLLPLGPDFARKSGEMLGSLRTSQLAQSATYQRLQTLLPGDSDTSRLRFLRSGLDSAQGWMNRLVTDRGLTPEKIVTSVRNVIDISDETLDYLSAFLDATTNYYEHTGIQAVTRHLIEDAAGSTGRKDARHKGAGKKKKA